MELFFMTKSVIEHEASLHVTQMYVLLEEHILYWLGL